MFCNEEKWYFSTSTQILKSVYVPGHTIYGMLKLNINALGVLDRKNNDFAEFKVCFIHRKQVPFLHKTVLIYAYLLNLVFKVNLLCLSYVYKCPVCLVF